MRYLISGLMAVVLCLGVVPSATAVNGDTRDWNITIKYEARDANLMGQSSAESGEPCSFMVYFGKGQQGVRTGFDPSVNPFEPWQNDVSNYSQRRSRSKEPKSSLPDLLTTLTIVIDPISDRRLRVELVTSRWELVDEPPPYDYRFETRSEEREIGIGDDWQFLAGTGPDDKEYYLELTIDPAGDGKRTAVQTRPRLSPLQVTYNLLTPDAPGQSVFKTVRKLYLSENYDDDGVEIQAPITVPGVDSSLLNVNIKLGQVILRNTGRRGQYEIDAVFELERWLMVDIQPTADTTQMILSHMISSSYNHAIHLRRNKKVRIEIPKIDSGNYGLNAREIIEIEAGADDDQGDVK